MIKPFIKQQQQLTKFMVPKKKILTICGLFCGALAAATQAVAGNVTQSGMFTADNSIFTYNFNLAAASPIVFSTTSYGGGTNLDGSTTAAGGFVPVLTLFKGSGSVITSDGGDGVQNGSAHKDPTTGLYNDAYISTSLAAGSYILTLSEFPNVALGNLSDGFLFSSDPHATGNACGNASGSFLESDVAPCVQRTGSYSLNFATPSAAVPEPGTLLLLIPALGAAALLRKRLPAARA